MNRGLWLVVVALVLLTLWPGSSQAQVPEKRQEFVYGINAFTGRIYQGTFYPLSEDTLYLLADVTNIISPRHSLVYFWPITNEQRVDWSGLNETVDGSLEIVQEGQVIQTIPGTQYIIQYPRGSAAGEVYVYLGAEAEAQYQEFDRLRRRYRDEVAEYYEASRNYRQDLEERAQSGTLKKGELPPPPPAEPEPFVFTSTGVFDGIPVKLPVGNYRIRLRDPQGQIVAGSERRLIVFDSGRNGVSYNIIPHDKWTIPDQSDDPSQVLYGRPDSIIYLQPYTQKEYNELYFTRLASPQSTLGSYDRWVWNQLEPIEAGQLELLQDGQVLERIAWKPYVVRQYTGSALGYEILDQETASEERLRSRTPDFKAFRVNINLGDSFSIRLIDPAGQVVPGSERQVKMVQAETANGYFLLPLLPLALGAGLTLWRRSKLAPLPK
jgi:hypothetical protein